MSSYTRDDLIDAWKEGYAQGRDDPFTEEGPSGYGAYHAAAEACADKIAATLRHGRVDEGMACRLYNSGYMAGHHATVEGGFVDVLPVDFDSYHDENVREILGEAALAQNTQGDGEAVAWLCDAPDDGVRTSVIAKALADMCERNGWTVQPLYLAAAPSQRAEVK